MATATKERSVIVTLRVKVDGKWRRLPAAYGGNGRIRPGYAQVGDEQVEFAGPAYELRLYEDRQAKYIPFKSGATDADAERKKLEKSPSKTAAKNAAESAGGTFVDKEDRQTLARTAAAYIRDAQQRGAMEAADQARLVNEEFRKLLNRKTYVDEITRDDIFKFHTALRKRGCSDRTVANKHQRLTSWLRFAGIDKTILPPVPKYEETLPTIYTSDEITTLLAEAAPYMKMSILLALKCGLRDQELMHLEFSDLNLADKTLRVQGKPRWNFKVKTHEQRHVPIPNDVLDELKAWKEKRTGQSLILGTKNGNPNTKLLFALKTLARRAKMNCGRCEGCKAKRRECETFTLHKFRRSYITTLLRNGIDLRTVQAYAGHKDIASTMRYLRPASAKEAQGKLNSVVW
ncbi:MAG: site-specific integrase [Acidobacteriota bacterium]|nr:site-specific integrase [Acidobacteriota bacterium]